MLLALSRHEVAPRDVQLVLLRVAREADDLHAIQQRRRDRLQHVRGRDEEHVRQVEGHLQVVIAEGVVLLRVEHLEHRRRRIALERPAPAELVDLIEHEDRVIHPDAPEPLDDPPRQRPDVRAPVAAHLRLIAHAAERDAVELTPGRARDGLPERGLAHARRPDEAQNRALDLLT